MTWTKEELRKVWENFEKEQEFILNPDKSHVDFIINGVLSNEKKHGLKYCPCRLRSRDFEKDLELICPCNFLIHPTYLNPKQGTKPMCWCGLFVKRN